MASQRPEHPRVTALRDYFKEVVRDLVTRGIIRSRRGEKIDRIISAEAQTFLAELSEDLKKIGFEMGSAIAESVVSSVFKRLFGQPSQRR